MADQHTPVEAEEHVDFDGDNDIDDMMDDEDPADDDNYRRIGADYKEGKQVQEDPVDDDSYRRTRDEYREREEEEVQQDQKHDHGIEEEHDKVSESDEVIDASSSMKDEEKPVESKDEADSEKRAELLSFPPHGSEVFVGGLPREATEEDLRELCEPLGEIFEIKLVKDKEKRESKGFAFITFTTKDAAQTAIEEIQDKEFKGRTLRCSLSQVKHRLFIGNVPKNLTEEDLRKILEENGPGVQNIEMFKDLQNPARNRGFLFVEYYNHACADYARQKMSSSNFKMDGSTPTISWAEPKNSADASAASQVKAIYLKNLPESATTEKLKEIFERHGEVTKVVLPPSKSGNKRDFGFIHFAERSSALKAVKGTEKYEIDGQAIEAVLAKPQADRKFDYASNAYKGGQAPSYPQYPSYGYSGDPYGAYGGGYGAGGVGQPVIYGRGPMPAGMRMVPMVLPDGRLGYVLQQPGVQGPPAPSPSRRGDRGGGGSSDGGSRGGDSRGRRFRPY